MIKPPRLDVALRTTQGATLRTTLRTALSTARHTALSAAFVLSLSAGLQLQVQVQAQDLDGIDMPSSQILCFGMNGITDRNALGV